MREKVFPQPGADDKCTHNLVQQQQQRDCDMNSYHKIKEFQSEQCVVQWRYSTSCETISVYNTSLYQNCHFKHLDADGLCRALLHTNTRQFMCCIESTLCILKDQRRAVEDCKRVHVSRTVILLLLFPSTINQLKKPRTVTSLYLNSLCYLTIHSILNVFGCLFSLTWTNYGNIVLRKCESATVTWHKVYLETWKCQKSFDKLSWSGHIY